MTHETAFIHHAAIVEPGALLGAGTRVWAFSHILPGARIGKDCNICDHTFIENEVKLGDRVTVKSGVYLWDGLKIESDVFIGPAAAFTNDLRPRSRIHPEDYPVTNVLQGCSIGANATILPGLRLGAWSMIAAGAVVTKDVLAHSVVKGSPAKHAAWICQCGKHLEKEERFWVCGFCDRKYTEFEFGLVEKKSRESWR